MAERDVATRAPESDAMETVPASTSQSIFPNDTPAQTGPTMGQHCTTDRPSPSGAKPSGTLTTLNSIPTYVSKPASYPSTSAKLLLLLTGGTGIASINNQLQADAFASEGFLVLMPDQFGGDPAPNTADAAAAVASSDHAQAAQQQDASWLDAIKLKTAEGLKSFLIDMWLARHTAEKVLPILHKVVEGARDEYADAIASGGGIYGAGYCFGAKYILILAGRHPDTVAWGQASAENAAKGDVEQGTVVQEPVLRAASVAHGTMVTKEDLEAVRAPTYIAAAKDDPLFSEEEVLTPGRRALEKEGVQHEVQVFTGVPHGFAVLGDYPDEGIRGKQQEAYEQMLAWLRAH